ncbi:MAG: Fe-S cluster assembly protein SufD [Gulosibacter sp.]|uniref:Fe-S cluster assembly protein SufD n=1 Tax=Gulosibacter sp. TaxID=2817531 RepID=UPI003F91AF3F
MTATQTPATKPEGKIVPVQTRSERPASFKVEDFKSVTGREAEWKYTPVRDIKDLLEGKLGADLPTVQTPEVAGIETSFIGRDDDRLGTIHAPEDRAAANAWESFEKALLVSISGEDEKEAVIRLNGYTGEAQAAHTFVDIAPHARALVVLVQEGRGRVSESVEIRVGDGANVTLVTVGEWDDDAVNVSAHHARVGRDAFLKHIVVSLSGKLVRLNPSIALADSGADAELYGLYFADAGQHLEHQVWVHHIAEKTRSRVTYKGALQGKDAHTVWIGDVLIDSNAVGTDTYEENRNLLLSRGPKADSVPNLEIKCGNIEGAGHASATGRFEEEQLFYLMARGIDERAARHLVVHGFLNEIIQQIDNEEITAELNERLEEELEIADRAFAAEVNA